MKKLMVAVFFMLLFLTANFGQSDKTEIDLQNAKFIEVGVTPEMINYRGKDALQLPKGSGERQIYLPNFEFENGIIELDIAAVPYYTGLTFRVRDNYVYEAIYFRPQNSVNDDPVSRSHTVQYIASPAKTWYYLRDTEPEKYESYANITPDEWFHVKVVVNGKKAEVFINNVDTPCLIVDDLKYGISKGSVGLWVGNYSPGTFANLTITPLPDSKLSGSEVVLEKPVYTPEQEYLFNTMKARRSVRNFKPDPVPQEHLMKILEMAATSPTSGNQQPWKFLVIQDRAKLDLLKKKGIERRIRRAKERGVNDEKELEKIRSGADNYFTKFLSAPVYVVVLVDSASKYPSYNIYDGSAASVLLMVAARALGYGTVFSQDSVPYELLKEVFEIPDQYERICFTPIGIPVEWPEPHNKKPLYELAVFEKMINGVNYNKWIKKVEIELPEKLLQDYAGEFRLDEDMTFTITVENSTVNVQMTGQPKFEIYPEAKDKFFLKVTTAEIHFSRNNNGRVKGLKFIQGSEEYDLTRIE